MYSIFNHSPFLLFFLWVCRLFVFLQETYAIEDCYRYDPATSDKTSQYTPIICYRGSATGSWNYNSSNGYYGNMSNDSAECMVVLSELTGKTDFTIEFDALLTITNALTGIVAYEDNNNYSRISTTDGKNTQRISVNASATENESNHTNIQNQWIHFKYTISNNQILSVVKYGDTEIDNRTFSYTVTQNTKFGFAEVWSSNWVRNSYLKNIKVKAL